MQQHSERKGTTVGEPLQHVIFLSGVYADTVERTKLAQTLAVAAYLACGYCVFQGVRCHHNTCFEGYQARVPQDMVHQGTAMYARDERLQLTDAYAPMTPCHYSWIAVTAPYSCQQSCRRSRSPKHQPAEMHQNARHAVPCRLLDG